MLISIARTKKAEEEDMAASVSGVRFGWIDHSGEYSSTNINVEPVDETTYVGIMGPAGAVDQIKAALATVSDCNLTGTSVSLLHSADASILPATVTAQREYVLVVVYQDTTTGKKGRFTIPGPIQTMRAPNSDKVLKTDAIWTAFAAVIEANIKSPEGNDVEVVDGYYTGRRA